MARTTVSRLLTVSLEPDVVARCDPARVRQIFGTLIRNAVDHTPDGSPIEVLLTAGDGTAEVSVRDFGPGMSSDQARALFDRPRDGKGLGLFVSQALARAHGGDLHLEQPPDGGCRFVLILPLD